MQGGSTNTGGLNMNNEGRQHMNATAAPFVPSTGIKSQSNPFATANPFGSHSLGDNSATAKSGAGLRSGGPPSFLGAGTHTSGYSQPGYNQPGYGQPGYGQLGGAGRGGVSQDARQSQGQGQGFFQNKGHTSSGNSSGSHITTTGMLGGDRGLVQGQGLAQVQGQGQGQGFGQAYQRHQSPPHQSHLLGPGSGPGPGAGPGAGSGPGSGFDGMSTARLDQRDQRADRATHSRAPRSTPHHPPVFSCRVCASAFPSYEEMKAHIKVPLPLPTYDFPFLTLYYTTHPNLIFPYPNLLCF